MTAEGGRLRRLATASVLALLGWAVLAGVLPAQAVAAPAPDGLDVTSTSRYEVQDVQRRVQVRIEFTATNVTPDQGDRYFFYTGFAMPLPKGATQVRAVSGGTALRTSTKPSQDPGVLQLDLAFPSRLLYRQSRTITVTFTLPGAAPRSADVTRVGTGFATFDVYGPGDAGKATVVVVAGSRLEYTGGVEAASKKVGATTEWTITRPSQQGYIWSGVVLRDPAAGGSQEVTVGAHRLRVLWTPQDEEWGRFAVKAIEQGMPVLEKLVGRTWPGRITTVREDPSPRLHGFGGWYSGRDDEIVLTEDLDSTLLYHELAHAWLNGDTTGPLWASEGLCEMLARRTVAATGGRPGTPKRVAPTDKGAFPLQTWRRENDQATIADRYGYPASALLMEGVFARSSDPQLAAALGVLSQGRTVYDVEGASFLQPGGVTPQSFVDAAEYLGESTSAVDLVQKWVVTTPGGWDLNARAEARQRYTALDTADGAWHPPLGVRKAMAAWDFAAARQQLLAAESTAAAVMAVQQTSRRAGVPVPGALAEEWTAAPGPKEYQALEQKLAVATRALDDIAEVKAKDAAGRGPLDAAGARLLGVPQSVDTAVTALAAGRLGPAAAEASVARADSDRATLVGAVALGALVLVLLLSGLVVRWLVRRRRRAAGVEGAPVGDATASTTAPVAGPAAGEDTPENTSQIASEFAADTLAEQVEPPEPAEPVEPAPAAPSPAASGSIEARLRERWVKAGRDPDAEL